MIKIQPGRAARACALALGLCCVMSGPSMAQSVDYSGLFRTKILNCLHPTVNADKATYELEKGPDTAGDMTTVRYKVFYPGIIGGKNSLEADLMVRKAGSIRQMKVNVLSDSGTTLAKCSLASNWTDF